MARFAKHVSGNPSGRPPNALGKKSIEHLTRARKLLTSMEQHKTYQTLLDNLTPREFSNLFRSLLEFTEPRMKSIEINDPNSKAVQITVRVQADPVVEVLEAPTVPELITESEEINQIDEEF